MAIGWLLPAAFAGLALIGIPVAIHLLVRQRSRQVAFPSLRFLEHTHIAALRRRSIDDAVLLAARVLIVAASVAALAGPVFQGDWRAAAYASRVARAVVVEAGHAPPVVQERSVWATETFSRARLAEGIAEAVVWLDAQPPAARELVVTAPFRRGQLSSGDLAAVPAHVGITLVPLEGEAVSRDINVPILRLQAGSLVMIDAAVHAGPETTSVSESAARAVTPWPIRVVAAARDQPLADAALRAVLDAGVRWPFTGGERIVVAWAGAGEPEVQAAAAGGATVVRMEAPRAASGAASGLRQALARSLPGMEALEPERISAEQLAAWSRPAGPPPAGAPIQDEGDRRYLWALVLVLLAAEHLLRRRQVQAAAVEPQEARVA